MTSTKLDGDELLELDAYLRAANYVTAGLIYLLVNPWLRAERRRHASYVAEHLEDMPEIRDWAWTV